MPHCRVCYQQTRGRRKITRISDLKTQRYGAPWPRRIGGTSTAHSGAAFAVTDRDAPAVSLEPVSANESQSAHEGGADDLVFRARGVGGHSRFGVMPEIEVRSRGLVGWFLTPGDGVHPGVLAVSGSDGGCPMQMARTLAGEGFACLALQYFKGAGLPKTLVEIPLEYIETALGWLRTQTAVNESPVGIVGPSKGAELALLTAAYFPTMVGAVVAYAPSSVAFAGIGGASGRHRSSWTYRGAPIPCVPYPAKIRPGLGLRGVSFAPIYRAALENSAAVDAAAIPIEHSDAPILLISGDRDQMWPSSTMADQLVARLAKAGKSDQVSHLRFPDAGHSFFPWRPDIKSERISRIIDGVRLMGVGGFVDLGGRAKANNAALRDAWPQVVSFLRRHVP